LKEITNSSSLLIFHFNPLTSFPLTVTVTSLAYLSASIALPCQTTPVIFSSVKVNPLTKIAASAGAFTLNLATS
jgi:methylglyoxal synthase